MGLPDTGSPKHQEEIERFQIYYGTNTADRDETINNTSFLDKKLNERGVWRKQRQPTQKAENTSEGRNDVEAAATPKLHHRSNPDHAASYLRSVQGDVLFCACVMLGSDPVWPTAEFPLFVGRDSFSGFFISSAFSFGSLFITTHSVPFAYCLSRYRLWRGIHGMASI